MEQVQLFMKQQAAEIQELKTQAETWKLIREASGVDAIVGSGTTAAFINQSREVIDAQSSIDKLNPDLLIDNNNNNGNDTDEV